jgi:hypothetical protein
MFRHLITSLAIACLVVTAMFAQESDSTSRDKSLDIRSSVGDLHVGGDADARKAGLPLYPGARLKADNGNDDKVNLGILTDAFGIKLVIAKYDSDDAPAKVIDYYRDKLGKYGKVLECHSRKHGGDVDVHNDDHDDDKESQRSGPVKCEGDNSGPVTELKVGTEDNQHVVAVEPREPSKGSTFAIVYVHTRGKRGEI